MTIVKGKILSQGVQKSYSYKGGTSYALAIKIDTLNYPIGIAYGASKLDAYQALNNNLLEVGKTYTFYINPTFPLSDGVDNGVSKIEYNRKVLYQHSETANIVFGFILILLGAIMLIFMRRKDLKLRVSKLNEI